MRQRYLNGILTANAILLGLIVLGASPFSLTSAAHAEGQGGQPETGMISAGEQRKQILNELKALNNKIERLENRLNKDLRVIVTQMPQADSPKE